MDHHEKLQIEGHYQGVRVHYTDRDIDERRAIYAKAYPHLELREGAAGEAKYHELEKTNREGRRDREAGGSAGRA